MEENPIPSDLQSKSPRKKFVLLILIAIILFLVITVIAYIFYFSQTPNQNDAPLYSSDIPGNQERNFEDTGIGPEYEYDPPKDPYIRARIKQIPQPNDPEYVAYEYYEFIKKEAVGGDKITFTSCEPDIPIISLNHGDSITFTNKDTTSHTFSINGYAGTFTINPNQSHTFNADFNTNSGTFHFYCDNNNDPRGALYIAEE